MAISLWPTPTSGESSPGENLQQIADQNNSVDEMEQKIAEIAAEVAKEQIAEAAKFAAEALDIDLLGPLGGAVAGQLVDGILGLLGFGGPDPTETILQAIAALSQEIAEVQQTPINIESLIVSEFAQTQYLIEATQLNGSVASIESFWQGYSQAVQQVGAENFSRVASVPLFVSEGAADSLRTAWIAISQAQSGSHGGRVFPARAAEVSASADDAL